ncbi:hypothetical protein V490_07851 [Pseudogymnoascus sp. VKM F-3557]|nr:hypothetical protein V490_07851 [Pseudogymnoascus sp. VKM F-3557]
MSSAPTIVVLGSTSGQGRGVVRAILSHPSLAHYHVVGVTRDVDGSTAKALLDAHQNSGDRLHLISADVYDRKSLLKAFEGAYGVFAVTSDNIPGKRMETEDELKHQLEAGKNIVAAAKEAAIEHFVFTSLPDVEKASGGKYTKVFHFDFKAQIEEMARSELKSATALLPGYFFTNLNWPWYCRRDGEIVRFRAPILEDTECEWVDAEYDVGVFAAAALAAGPTKTRNKVYPVGRKYSQAQLASILERRTSVKAEVRPSTLEEWADATVAILGPAWRVDLRQMMEWTDAMPKGKIGWGTIDLAEDRGFEELATRVGDRIKLLGVLTGGSVSMARPNDQSIQELVGRAIIYRELAEKSGTFLFIGLARKNPCSESLSIQTYLCPELYATPRTRSTA